MTIHQFLHQVRCACITCCANPDKPQKHCTKLHIHIFIASTGLCDKQKADRQQHVMLDRTSGLSTTSTQGMEFATDVQLMALTFALALLKAMSTAVLFSLAPSRPLSRHSLAKLAPSIPACMYQQSVLLQCQH